jgi:hypothetical protein
LPKFGERNIKFPLTSGDAILIFLQANKKKEQLEKLFPELFSRRDFLQKITNRGGRV